MPSVFPCLPSEMLELQMFFVNWTILEEDMIQPSASEYIVFASIRTREQLSIESTRGSAR